METKKKQASNEYKVNYAKEHYYRMEITVPVNAQDAIKKAAQEAGETPTEYVKNALKQRLGIKEWDEITMKE